MLRRGLRAPDLITSQLGLGQPRLPFPGHERGPSNTGNSSPGCSAARHSHALDLALPPWRDTEAELSGSENELGSPGNYYVNDFNSPVPPDDYLGVGGLRLRNQREVRGAPAYGWPRGRGRAQVGSRLRLTCPLGVLDTTWGAGIKSILEGWN